MLRIVLADSELELIPQEIADHPSVKSFARRRGKQPGKLLLDSSFVYPALRKLPEGERRGRPDIIHLFLLVCLDSILNQRSELEVSVHTRNDDVISVSPTTRLPKNYNRFVGLLEDLYEREVVPSTDNPLLRLERSVPLSSLLKRLGGSVALLTEEAPIMTPARVFNEIGVDAVCVVGGFPHGGFRSSLEGAVSIHFSLWKEPLKAWTVASELVTSYARFVDEKAS